MKDFFESRSSGDIINIMAVIVAVILTIAGIIGAIASKIAVGTSIVVIVIGMIAAKKAFEHQKPSYSAFRRLFDDIPKEKLKKYVDESQRPKSQEIPDILPYLPNLHPQEDELEQTIRYWNYQNRSEDEKHCPLLCLIHGHVNQNGKLMARLGKYFAVKLGPNDSYQSIEAGYLSSDEDIKPIFLNSAYFYRAANPHKEIWKRLLEQVAFSYTKNDWKREIARTLAKEIRPIFVHTTIDVAKWQGQHITDFIHEFIKFWYDKGENWSEIIAQENLVLEQPLVVCLFFQYDQTRQRQKWFKKQIPPFELPKLGLLEFYKQYQAYGVILPALSSVERGDVFAWADNYKQTICRYCDIESVKDGIGKLYKKQDDTIPMRELGAKLREILEKP